MDQSEHNLKIPKYFKQLSIRDVPMGVVLNSETESNFPLVSTHNYTDPCGFTLSHSYKDEWLIIPPSNDASTWQFLDGFCIRGSLEECLLQHKDLVINNPKNTYHELY